MARTTPRSARSGQGRTISERRRIFPLLLIVAGVAVLALGGLYALWAMGSGTALTRGQSTGAEAGDHTHSNVELPHIHGLGFSSDGKQLFVPAHTGLRVFADGTWLTPNIPAHDYMGYVATDDGFYSSGHPDPASGLANPLGLVKSTDGGKTLINLGFEGESDFHLMGVGYQNHAIYALNPAPNSRLPAGLHYSLDDGKTWQQSAMQGLTAQPIQIAVHPTEANVIALATEDGLFISSDHGNTFERIGVSGPIMAVAFSPNREQLSFGSTTLSVYDLQSKQVQPLQTPELATQDAISYIAINPVQSDEIAFTTFERDIYLTKNGGQSWQQIAQDGTAIATQ